MPKKIAVISFLLLLCVITCGAQHSKSKFLRCIACHSHGDAVKHIYTPTSPEYHSLLRGTTRNGRWLNSTGERPFLIFAPHEESQIGPLIECAKAFNYQITICSGGHDYEGLSLRSRLAAPFVMLALTNLDRADVDVAQETAWVQSGVSLGQLYYEISRKSPIHAFPGGLYGSVGTGGHISGGGLGTLVRKYGLAADNVLDARVVDSNGQISDRESMGEDLFWAIRGGGASSFCVVLAWKLRLVRVPANVTAFTFRRRLDSDNRGLLQKWQREAHRLSGDLFIRILIQNVATGDTEKIVCVSYNGLFLGPASDLVPELDKTFPEFGLAAEDCFEPPVGNYSCPEQPCIKKICNQLPWIESVLFFSGKTGQPLEALLNKTTRKHGYNKGTSDFLTKPIPERGWEMIRDRFLSEEQPMMIVDPFGGKMDDIPEDETPFPYRKGTNFVVQYLTNWAAEKNEEEEAGEHLAWIRNLYAEMEPYVAGNPRAAYLNYRDLDLGQNDGNYSYENGKKWGEKYFKGNFERLAKVKGTVDPGNFFRFEQSVPVLSLL